MSLPARPGFWKSFSRSQVASLAATAVDFGTLVFLVEVGHVWYVAATAIGAAFGAVTNFLLGRHWSFQATHDVAHRQAVRYAVVSGASLVLNSLGVWALTDLVGLKYFESKIVTALLVGVLFNFPLHRGYVFR